MNQDNTDLDAFTLHDNGKVLSLSDGRERRESGQLPRRYKLAGMIAKAGNDKSAIQKIREQNNSAIKRSYKLGSAE